MTTTTLALVNFLSSPQGIALVVSAWIGLMSAASAACQSLGWIKASKITAGLMGLDVGGLMRWSNRVREARAGAKV
jgi:hypothetical protein